ncbi:hypothetical protein [Streptomyces chattanoogensis]|uniref:Uncharacterized protein n=1 Tax=Streptomyces chattanoogensis TaxID=66876 RepID=A0A0N0XYP9_9ACTN|nr:hypothetical protein [Streptomyces chattanoogensis]KPC64248.1 hypothetical protein ADL29_11960 [Streptomyces chattanoogensis]
MKFDQNERDVERLTKPTTLEMPRQAPPIDRTGHTTPGMYGDNQGVDANGLLTGILSKFLPI